MFECKGVGSEWDLFRFLFMMVGLVIEFDVGIFDATEYLFVGIFLGAANASFTMMLLMKLCLVCM